MRSGMSSSIGPTSPATVTDIAIGDRETDIHRQQDGAFVHDTGTQRCAERFHRLGFRLAIGMCGDSRTSRIPPNSSSSKTRVPRAIRAVSASPSRQKPAHLQAGYPRADADQRAEFGGRDMADGTSVGFNIETVSPPGDVMSFKLRNSTSGAARIVAPPVVFTAIPSNCMSGPAFRDASVPSAHPGIRILDARMGIRAQHGFVHQDPAGYKSRSARTPPRGTHVPVVQSRRRVICLDLEAHGFDKKTSSLSVEKISEDR